MSNIEDFRNGIFSLQTRRFGDVAEIMIKKIYNMSNSNVLNFDKEKDGKRIEVKFSRGLKKNDSIINEYNIVEQCLKGSPNNRSILSTEATKYKFDCNIQQIKNKEFDELYFGIFFKDVVEIFKITSQEIENLSNYSNKQHRGNVGEGQFHLNQKNIENYRQKYLIRSLTYQELYQILECNND